MQFDNATVRRLRVVAEADPGTLVRVLQYSHARNVVPRRAIAWRLGIEFLEIEIDIDAAECAEEAFRVVVARINELPTVLAAVACSR